MGWYSDAPGCIRYSDDGGKTYQTTPVHGPPGYKLENEVSFAALSDGSVYANGRAANAEWAPHRMDFWSKDNGMRWNVSKSELEEPVYNGEMRQTSRGLIAGHVNSAHQISTLYSSEPAGGPDSARSRMVVSCSLDGGKTWPHSTTINGNQRAEYSTLWLSGSNARLVAAWGWNDSFGHTVGEQILSIVIKTNWCLGPHRVST